MFLDPRLPSRHAFSFLRTAIAFGKGAPGRSLRTGFAAKEHGEIGIVRAHDVSLSFAQCKLERQLDMTMQLIDARGRDSRAAATASVSLLLK